MIRMNMLWKGKKTATLGFFEYDVDEGLFYIKRYWIFIKKRIKIAGGNLDKYIKSGERIKINVPMFGTDGRELLIINYDLHEMEENNSDVNADFISELENVKAGRNIMFKQKVLSELRADEFSSREMVKDEQKKTSDHIKRIQSFAKTGGN